MAFHRAFDVMRGDVETELEQLIRVGFCRVLSSGRAATAPEGAAVLLRCVERAGDRLQVLAGGGVRAHNAAELLLSSGVHQVHFTCHTDVFDRSAAGAPVRFDMPGAREYAVRIVDAERLRQHITQLRALPLRGTC